MCVNISISSALIEYEELTIAPSLVKFISQSAPIFVLTFIWPAVATAFYFIVQAAVVIRVLRETKPLGELFLFVAFTLPLETDRPRRFFKHLCVSFSAVLLCGIRVYSFPARLLRSVV